MLKAAFPKWWYELYPQARRNFWRMRVAANGTNEIWCADLVEMQQFSKWKEGFRTEAVFIVSTIVHSNPIAYV